MRCAIALNISEISIVVLSVEELGSNEPHLRCGITALGQPVGSLRNANLVITGTFKTRRVGGHRREGLEGI